MLIIIDQKMSPVSKKKLSSYGELLELRTEGITYQTISGHPDIFFCQSADHMIVAPNLPVKYFDQLIAHNIDFIIGEFPVGPEYPTSARYNAVATSKYLIHNFRHTDFMITRTLEDLQPVHVDQGYCRCNLLPLKEDHFITSDEGIFKVLRGLQPNGMESPGDGVPLGWSPPGRYLLVSPSDILLEGFPHGFFGGCCGVLQEKVFINGSLTLYSEGGKVRDYLASCGYEIVELYDGPLTDVGSLFFIE